LTTFPVGGSWGASLIAALVAEGCEALDAPPRAVAAQDNTPIPCSEVLEAAWIPACERIAATIRETLAL
jgi:pyruvate/2-oxoglutarate/acetoin dehydrogenase E1 component